MQNCQEKGKKFNRKTLFHWFSVLSSSTCQKISFQIFLDQRTRIYAACTDPLFYWSAQIFQIFFTDQVKHFKYFLLIRSNISNISWSTCQKMQLALTHFFIDRFKYPATAQKWWLSYSRPLQLVANWTSQKTK